MTIQQSLQRQKGTFIYCACVCLSVCVHIDVQCVHFVTHLRFSELNSDSRNLRNCSLPTGSLRTSSMPKAHLFTLCWPGSLLEEDTQNCMVCVQRNTPQAVKIYLIDIQVYITPTWLQAPRVWCHLRSRGWMDLEALGKGRIQRTALCSPAN